MILISEANVSSNFNFDTLLFFKPLLFSNYIWQNENVKNEINVNIIIKSLLFGQQMLTKIMLDDQSQFLAFITFVNKNGVNININIHIKKK